VGVRVRHGQHARRRHQSPGSRRHARGTPISELCIAYGCAHQQLADRGINVTRSYVGEYCTSLDMAGASLTLVKLDDELNKLFDAPAAVAMRIF
jgi:dihydroxyacetone kinase-like protein